jgi:MFS family permease
VGGLPAILVAYFYNRVHEPERWQNKIAQFGGKWSMHRAFLELFSPLYRRRTILNSMYILASIGGLWAGSAYVPTAITELARSAGLASDAAKLASWSGALLAIGTIIGAILSPFLGEWLGRRGALAVFFSLMLIFIMVAFGYVFYMGTGALGWFLVCTFFLGLGGGSFAVYSFWIPEQYATECRASAFAFTTSVGRFAGAALTFLVGAGIRHFDTLGTPVALTSLAFVVGLLLLPFGVETKGKALPT